MRIQILIATSNYIPEHEFHVYTQKTPRLELESDLSHEITETLVNYDACLIYSRPQYVHIEHLLSNNVHLCNKMAGVLSSNFGESCDVSIKLFRTYGYMLRLVGLTTLLVQVVNTYEDLVGTTVIADVMGG